MTPQSKTANLALMCKSHNYESYPHAATLGEYRVGNWVISEKKRKELLGEIVILTESQQGTAYRVQSHP